MQFLLESSFFIGQKTTNSTIKSYFITRKDLTQKMLHELTEFSRGTISQSLNVLGNIGIIEKTNVSSKGAITYSMKSAEKAFIQSFVSFTKDILRYTEELSKLKSEMESEKNELEKVDGFNIVYQMISNFTKAMPLTLKIMKMFEKEISVFKKT